MRDGPAGRAGRPDPCSGTSRLSLVPVAKSVVAVLLSPHALGLLAYLFGLGGSSTLARLRAHAPVPRVAQSLRPRSRQTVPRYHSFSVAADLYRRLARLRPRPLA